MNIIERGISKIMNKKKRKRFPDGSTPIKNEILIEIFAKGRLKGARSRIAFYIIRHSWGFDDKKNNRRQDWTRPLSITRIAKDIGMSRPWCSKIINKMVEENILFRKNRNQFQFNEHWETWKVSSPVDTFNDEKCHPQLTGVSSPVDERVFSKTQSKTDITRTSETDQKPLKKHLKKGEIFDNFNSLIPPLFPREKRGEKNSKFFSSPLQNSDKKIKTEVSENLKQEGVILDKYKQDLEIMRRRYGRRRENT